MGLKESLFNFRKKSNPDVPKVDELLSDDELAQLWKQCPSCKHMNYHTDLEANLMKCTGCGHHFRINSAQRIEYIFDADTWTQLYDEVLTIDPLEFVDLKPYPDRVKSARKSAQTTEAIVTGYGKVRGQDLACAIMEFGFLGGSMGSVVGERICRIAEYAIEHKMPLMIISASGGARMHEGLVSLFQMAKTSSTLARLREAGLLFISMLVDPTYGGVSASYSMLGDIILAEPKAKIGFAGPRVIEETIRQKLPKDFQTSEYLLEHGQIDMVVDRADIPDMISRLIAMHKK